MKIVIISDIHDNTVNLNTCLNWCLKNKIKKMICCGDVTNIETLKNLSKNFKGDIFLVKGNADSWYDEDVKELSNIKYLGRGGGIFKINKREIGVCHEPYLFDELIKPNKPDIVFYGHTHKPWEQKKQGVVFVNPGTLGGMFQDGTFAVFDVMLGELKLKRVN
ncbi:YfcE family phosphodiesterase [Candidatus Parcubacteria bacterium]|nr:YfcE family phosphodiesterase [Candidatus Parcubacteria bacterium]